MLSLKKLDQLDYEKKQKKKIDHELPYFITIITLLATSGLGPYFIFKKIKEINLLPTVKTESEKILKRIDLLGMDPLAAMNQAKDKPSSKALGEFLGGYVSSIQSGGNVINYLKSKMITAYENHENEQKHKTNGIREADEFPIDILTCHCFNSNKQQSSTIKCWKWNEINNCQIK